MAMDPADLAVFASSAAMSASYTVEVSIPLIHPSWIEYVRDLAYLVDRRLERKLLLPEGWMEIANDIPQTLEELQDEIPPGARPFLDAGWETRITSYPRVGLSAIFDRAQGIYAPGLALDFPIGGEYPPPPKLEFIEGQRALAEPIRAFEQGWKEGRRFESVYQSEFTEFGEDESEEEEREIILASDAQFSDLMKYFANHPEKMRELPPRKFEELVADLFRKEGFDAALTPTTRDGGRDILVTSNTALGKHLHLIECKRHAENNPVDVKLLRSLYGVVEAERATGGMIVTTTRITPPGIRFINSVKNRLSKRDYEDLVVWIKKHAG